MEETRLCKSCDRVFPLTHEYFNYRDKAKGQFQGMCRECRHAYLNSRLENPEIRERERESKRRFYWTHKEQEKERSLAMTKLEECVMWANASIARNE